MSPATSDHSSQNIATEAAKWFISLQTTEVSRGQQEAFADWLRRSPAHIEEFLQLTALQGDLSRLPELKSIDVDKLLVDLDPAEAARNVVPLNLVDNENADSPRYAGSGEEEGLAYPLRQKSGYRRARRFSIAAAAVVTLAAIGLWFSGPFRNDPGEAHYETDIGELRSLTLSDGSHIQLNAVSNLSAKVNETERELRLKDGEALFRVAKDAAHPFRVHTPQATIEAKGTQFNVNVTNGRTVVSLIEGLVLITRPGGSSHRGGGSILLNPGEQVLIAEHATTLPQPHRVDLKSTVAWTEHRLEFEDTPLSEVIAEFNRYSREPFVIEDPTLGAIRITLSFDSQNVQTFADALAANGTLRVVHQASGAWLIERK